MEMKKKIEITLDEFMENSAKVCATDEGLKALISEAPMFLTVFGLFTASLAHALFDDEDDETKDTEEESDNG